MKGPDPSRIIRPLRRLTANRRVRLTTAVAASLVSLASVMAVSLHQTPQPALVQMRNGTIWVASNQVGELTLLNGVSVEVGARVTVARNGGRLSVSQTGADGYVINQSNGDTTRVDGATGQAARVTRLMGGSFKDNTPAEQHRLLVSGSTVYQLDPAGGWLVAADAQSLVPRGSPVEIARESKGITTGDGLAWILDRQTGELHRYGNQTQAPAQRPRPTGADELVSVAQHPVLLDYQSGNATLVDPQTGEPTATLDAELTEHDIAWGSAETQRLVIVRPRQGAMSVCRFDERTCAAPVHLTDSSAALGAAIEVNDHVLVPNYGEGTVYIVDLTKMATVEARLFDPQRRPDRFELLTRDGIAFFNDPDSERAGVIELDGTVRHIVKYDPVTPEPTSSASVPQSTDQVTPSDSSTPKPTRSGSPNTRSPENNRDTGTPETNNRPGGGTPTSSTPTSSNTGTPTVTVPDVVGRPSATATSTLTSLGLTVATNQAPSNTVPAGSVVAQTPGSGTSVPAGSQITLTISTGKRSPFSLMDEAPDATWITGVGTVPFPGTDGDPRGGAKVTPANTWLLEDGSAPRYLTMHPQWVNFGWINGVYDLSVPIMAGDHFRARIGFVKTCCNVSVGDAEFVVRVLRSGTWIEVSRTHDIGRDGILYDIDVDLSTMQGATAVMLRVEAGVSAGQDWAAWVNPRIEG